MVPFALSDFVLVLIRHIGRYIAAAVRRIGADHRGDVHRTAVQLRAWNGVFAQRKGAADDFRVAAGLRVAVLIKADLTVEHEAFEVALEDEVGDAGDSV